MEDYKEYPIGTKVRIKTTGQIGEVYESLMGVISVWVEDIRECSYYALEDVEFI